ncbi:uncharacterized protein MYCFIDRAFT_176244 [Pseudocercospora fijiensis CIRAD86]|uniref:Uncharacterized protein n=1 Tax=Pseudocercospora fijiensis (strain CIRAD86) TaxID=383855 RepID=M3ATS5_PSEFD|nr:uncharacterized protein MYCFIDRAFT_176244 [Pseudocercospora fijiensis CIRAD86]EME80882.1 hypothetical protein MYCFIDRAFT_176244 [Pseudocercospora fijiensis CIRAD86]
MQQILSCFARGVGQGKKDSSMQREHAIVTYLKSTCDVPQSQPNWWNGIDVLLSSRETLLEVSINGLSTMIRSKVRAGSVKSAQARLQQAAAEIRSPGRAYDSFKSETAHSGEEARNVGELRRVMPEVVAPIAPAAWTNEREYASDTFSGPNLTRTSHPRTLHCTAITIMWPCRFQKGQGVGAGRMHAVDPVIATSPPRADKGRCEMLVQESVESHAQPVAVPVPGQKRVRRTQAVQRDADKLRRKCRFEKKREACQLRLDMQQERAGRVPSWPSHSRKLLIDTAGWPEFAVHRARERSGDGCFLGEARRGEARRERRERRGADAQACLPYHEAAGVLLALLEDVRHSGVFCAPLPNEWVNVKRESSTRCAVAPLCRCAVGAPWTVDRGPWTVDRSPPPATPAVSNVRMAQTWSYVTRGVCWCGWKGAELESRNISEKPAGPCHWPEPDRRIFYYYLHHQSPPEPVLHRAIPPSFLSFTVSQDSSLPIRTAYHADPHSEQVLTSSRKAISRRANVKPHTDTPRPREGTYTSHTGPFKPLLSFDRALQFLPSRCHSSCNQNQGTPERAGSDDHLRVASPRLLDNLAIPTREPDPYPLTRLLNLMPNAHNRDEYFKAGNMLCRPRMSYTSLQTTEQSQSARLGMSGADHAHALSEMAGHATTATRLHEQQQQQQHARIRQQKVKSVARISAERSTDMHTQNSSHHRVKPVFSSRSQQRPVSQTSPTPAQNHVTSTHRTTGKSRNSIHMPGIARIAETLLPKGCSCTRQTSTVPSSQDMHTSNQSERRTTSASAPRRPTFTMMKYPSHTQNNRPHWIAYMIFTPNNLSQLQANRKGSTLLLRKEDLISSMDIKQSPCLPSILTTP